MRLTITLLTGLLCGTPSALGGPEDSIATLQAWWQGDYNNASQTRTPGPFFALRGRYRTVDLPAIGTHVMIVEEYRDGDQGRLHSLRLQTLTAEDGGVRISFRPLRVPEKFADAVDTPDRLKSLTAADVIQFPAGCDILVRFDGTVFRGTMAPGTCPRGPDLTFEYEMVVGPEYYWFREQGRRKSDGGVGWEQAPGSQFGYFKLAKLRR